MELSAAELKIIQDLRNAEAKKIEASQSLESKALAKFSEIAAKQNSLASELKNLLGYSTTCGVHKNYNTRVMGTWFSADALGFVEFGVSFIVFTDAFKNQVTVTINSEDEIPYRIDQIWSIDSRAYNGKNASLTKKAVEARMEELRAKQVKEQISATKAKNATDYIKARYPKAAAVRVYEDKYESLRFEASNFLNRPEYTNVTGYVQFNDDLTIKSTSTVSYSAGTQDDSLQALKKQCKEAVAEIERKFAALMEAELTA